MTPARPSTDPDDLLASLTESSLYSIGAYFCDAHPDLVEDVLEQSVAIERDGLVAWAQVEGVGVDTAFQTLMTGLAIRYFTAVAGGAA